jgi:hypothetical protein
MASLFGCDCVPKRQQSRFEDTRVRIPMFDSGLQIDSEVDGYALQAMQIMADDLRLSRDPTTLPCADRQVAQTYRTRREGDIIFVRIDFKPENCGRTIGMLDGGATYAISLDGRILRRSIDALEPYQDTLAPPQSAPVSPPPGNMDSGQSTSPGESTQAPRSGVPHQ